MFSSVPGGGDLCLVLCDDPLPLGLHPPLPLEEAGVEEALQGLELGLRLGVFDQIRDLQVRNSIAYQQTFQQNFRQSF